MVTELNVMKRLKPHPHVLKLIGCCSIGGKYLVPHLLCGTRYKKTV